MEITNENKEEVFEHLESKGQIALVNHIKNTFKINEENYGSESGYSSNDGYGAVIFIMKEILEYAQVKMKYGFKRSEIMEEIKEDNNVPSSFYLLYLTGDDSGVAIYITEIMKNEW